MDKELKKLLKDLNGVLGDFLDKNKDKMSKMLNDRFNKASKEEFKISAEREKNGSVKVEFKGDTLAILVGLAGLEKSILKQLKTPDSAWELIKDAVDMEAINE